MAASPPVAERLAELGREIADLSRLLRSGPTMAAMDDCDALLRLALGDSRPIDIGTLSVPVTGSRLLVVRSRAAGLLASLRPDEHRQQFHVCDIPNEGILLLVAGRRQDPDRKAAAAVVSGIRGYDPDALVGVSSVIGGLADLPGAYREASELVEMTGPEGGRCLFADDCWAALTLRRLVPLLSEALPALNPIERLRGYDSRRRSDLTRSVYTWIMCNCDMGAAASQLFVHPNTLRYRLQRAEQISGLDLGNADERMLFQLGYKAAREMGEGQAEAVSDRLMTTA